MRIGNLQWLTLAFPSVMDWNLVSIHGMKSASRSRFETLFASIEVAYVENTPARLICEAMKRVLN